MKIDTIIVDDDSLARKVLQSYCTKIPELNVVESFSTPNEVLNFVSANEVALILLDIEMPDMSGIELLNMLPCISSVIFTTSKTEYACEAFELGAIDYLKKPIKFSRFQSAINKVKDNYQSKELPCINSKYIYIKEKGVSTKVAFNDILYFENVRDYVCIKTIDKTFTIIGTLKEIIEKLPPNFLKVHRSYIINKDKIINIDESSLLIENKVIPISRANRPILFKNIIHL